MKLDYTLLDPGRKPAPTRDEPDPRDIRDHLEAQKTIRQRIADHQKRIARHEGTVEIPPTDDAPLTALEPFGVTVDMLSKLDWIGSIGDARTVAADPQEKGPWLGPAFRAVLRKAVAGADRWLAARQ